MLFKLTQNNKTEGASYQTIYTLLSVSSIRTSEFDKQLSTIFVDLLKLIRHVKIIMLGKTEFPNGHTSYNRLDSYIILLGLKDKKFNPIKI